MAIDLFAGLFGFSAGCLEAGWRVVGFDIERKGPVPKGAELVIQDVSTLAGWQLKDADLIVASPPCTEYSYMAMPWLRAKQIAGALRGTSDFPAGYKGSRTIAELTALFDACFRIQREACEAAGRYIPLIVENVRGAQPWVGRAKAHYGSFYLWGSAESIGGAIVPSGRVEFGMERVKANVRKNSGGSWFNIGSPGQTEVGRTPVNGVKQGGNWWHDPESMTRKFSSRSSARKQASAEIAKIPFALSSWVARCFKP